MNNRERQQQRRLVGWWLGVSPGNVVSGEDLARQLEAIKQEFDRAVTSRDIYDLLPRAKDTEIKKRILRVEQALAGTAMSAIAVAEGIQTTYVSFSVKDTLQRLALRVHQETESNETARRSSGSVE